MGTPSSNSFVLLCAEDDDLELVRWVDVARAQGLAPEVVTGIERDDEPLVDALSDGDRGLFVVLRSDNLDAARLREIKTLFARHRHPHQRLTAIRLERAPQAAIAQIAGELRTPSRPRSEVSMVVRLDDTGPQPIMAVRGLEPPTIDSALLLAQQVAEAEITERVVAGDHTEPMAVGAAPAAPAAAPRRRRGALGLAAAIVIGLGGAAAAAIALSSGNEVDASDRAPSSRVTAVAAAEVAPAAAVVTVAPTTTAARPVVAPATAAATRSPEAPKTGDAPTVVALDAPAAAAPAVAAPADAAVDASDPVEVELDAAPEPKPRRATTRRAKPRAVDAAPSAAAGPEAAPAPGAPGEPELPSEPAPLE